jgi:hypothetical protein
LAIFLVPDQDIVQIQARADAGKFRGYLAEYIRPGGQFLGWSYEELREIGNGLWDLQLKNTGQQPVRLPTISAKPADEPPQPLAPPAPGYTGRRLAWRRRERRG